MESKEELTPFKIVQRYERGATTNQYPPPKPQKDVKPLAVFKAELPSEQLSYEDEERDKVRLTTPFPLVFRGIEKADFHFVLNAWMVSYRNTRRDMCNQEYFAGQQNLIAELAKRRRMVIACDGDAPEWVAGFACGLPLEGNKLLIDYVYVKQAYRMRGIARGLVKALGWNQNTEVIATHRTRVLEPNMRRWNTVFNDYFNRLGYSDV